MKKIERFEDLKCWQESRVLVKKNYQLSSSDILSKDRDTRSQFRRAALSIMNNIAEGFGRFSKKEKIRFLEYSSSSASEVKSMLYLFKDLKYLQEPQLEFLFEQVTTTQKLTLGFIRYLKS
jgi:four helix bundle protein